MPPTLEELEARLLAIETALRGFLPQPNTAVVTINPSEPIPHEGHFVVSPHPDFSGSHVTSADIEAEAEENTARRRSLA